MLTLFYVLYSIKYGYYPYFTSMKIASKKVTCPRMQAGQDSLRSVALDSMLSTTMLHQQEDDLRESNLPTLITVIHNYHSAPVLRRISEKVPVLGNYPWTQYRRK